MIRAIAMLALLCSSLAIRAEAALLIAQTAECTRESLQATVDKYLNALNKGNPSLMPLAPQAKYMENRNEVPLGQGIWMTPLAVDFNRSLLDVETCQTFTEIIHTSSDHPYVIGTRLQIEDNKISEIESLVADKDDWLFNAEDYLKYSSQEKWDIPKSEVIVRPYSTLPMRTSILLEIIPPYPRCLGASHVFALKAGHTPIAKMIRIPLVPLECPKTAASK